MAEVWSKKTELLERVREAKHLAAKKTKLAPPSEWRPRRLTNDARLDVATDGGEALEYSRAHLSDKGLLVLFRAPLSAWMW